jgi:hypothetical protein
MNLLKWQSQRRRKRGKRRGKNDPPILPPVKREGGFSILREFFMHPYDKHVAEQDKLHKRRMNLMVIVFVAVLVIDSLFMVMVFSVEENWLTIGISIVVAIINFLSIWWLSLGGRWTTRNVMVSGAFNPKALVRSIMVKCRCGKHGIFSGHSPGNIPKEAQVCAQIRAAEKGWVFLEDCVKCPECAKENSHN